jgi:hypothetical protein
VKTVELISKIVGDAIKEGNAVAKVKQAEMKSESERMAKEGETHREGDEAKVQRKMRERKSKAPKKDDPRTEDKPAEAPKAEDKPTEVLAVEEKPTEAKPEEK